MLCLNTYHCHEIALSMQWVLSKLTGHLWAKRLDHFMQVVMFKQLKIYECVEFEVGWTSLLRHAGFTISQQS